VTDPVAVSRGSRRCRRDNAVGSFETSALLLRPHPSTGQKDYPGKHLRNDLATPTRPSLPSPIDWQGWASSMGVSPTSPSVRPSHRTTPTSLMISTRAIEDMFIPTCGSSGVQWFIGPRPVPIYLSPRPPLLCRWGELGIVGFRQTLRCRIARRRCSLRFRSARRVSRRYDRPSSAASLQVSDHSSAGLRPTTRRNRDEPPRFPIPSLHGAGDLATLGSLTTPAVDPAVLLWALFDLLLQPLWGLHVETSRPFPSARRSWRRDARKGGQDKGLGAWLVISA
jgi:hypothetical protein